VRARIAPFLLSLLVPGTGHVYVGRTRLGAALAIAWTLSVHVILHGTWVVPKLFAPWAVPAAWAVAVGLWIAAQVSLLCGGRAQT
jgi:hypothetical protein